MKGCAYCGEVRGLVVLDEGARGLPAVVCTVCGARGPEGTSEESVHWLFARRPREARAWVQGLCVGLAVGGALVAVILGGFANRARADLVRELDAAWELTAAAEARAFDRGLASAQVLREADEWRAER